MIKKISITILILLLCFAIYMKVMIGKIDYDFNVKEYKPVRINPTEGGVINIVLDIIIKSPFFFNIPVQSLYYEIYYSDNLLGKSVDTSGFTIKAKEDTLITQKIDITIDRVTINVAKNYLLKKPTDFIAKVYVRFLGIPIKLTNIKFTY